ncbi:tRNA (N6-isopentenyl adenosine(37)-C2)-methylthiotransferase MiaB [Desulfobulbus oligotrophicus]|uniref:tRNA-2-methylthio-N(6)-dimethylallyladenosine synthase n=1 Tax=Desulfobulbus oligotrophicus TaxID=1909699 RepID=A0A7T5VEG4_9BACT|nr:tRNA (N6-isopentenyl adenosine(37)-C2)-methylthiotransferase MiaB [Desulfobulbus oligotrophicus]QQG66257.1 tRNA (N6-isopentenyl adenosine(37)-C2)-methylthiotransferase MiaB [Desulfobulbus oligotrophicus]
MSRKLYIKTFGCQMNERDSEVIAQLLAQEGFATTSVQEEADLILVNTCSIREKAEQKAFSLIGSLREEKKKNPSLVVGVIGCVAQQEGEHLRSRMPHVDLIVGTQQIYRLPAMLDRLLSGMTQKEIATNMESSFSIPPFQKLLVNNEKTAITPGFKQFVTIMQGCDNFCSYCVVPTTRGREISRSVRDILEEVELLVEQGVREITLLGQNVNSYGATNTVDPRPVSFPQLLRKVSAVQGLQRLRFTTSHPKDLSEELMQCFAELENLCPHFHLPVQSGSDKILQRMNRKYTVESYLQKVARLRQYRPDIALATDVIVGFPGETDVDFAATMRLLQEVRFHGSFSFKYSDRPHTRSTSFTDKIPEEIKSKRLATFQKEQNKISLQRNREYLEKTVEIMIESILDGEIKGRTATNHMVHAAGNVDSLLPGDLALVIIEHAGNHSLKGRLSE